MGAAAGSARSMRVSPVAWQMRAFPCEARWRGRTASTGGIWDATRKLVREEELLEGGVVSGHGNGEFGLIQMASQALGERRSLANGFLDDVGKFGGMRGGQDQALRRLGMFFAEGFPSVDADGGVRVGDVTEAIPDVMHFPQSFFIGDAVPPNFLADIFDAIATEVEKTREIVGITDVHGIGISGDSGARTIFAGEQVLRNDIVRVSGSDETRNGDTDTLGKNTSGEVAEIAAGNGDDQGHGSDGQLAIRGDMIEHLRKQPADVDGIGGGEEGALVELFIGEGLLDQTLAIVEGAGDFKGGNVLAECGELFFLSVTDALGWIEDDDANAGHVKKAVGNRAAGISRSGDKNGEWTGFAANKIAHEARHETGAEILEREGGAMKELKDVERGGKRDQLDREINGFRDDLPENLFRDVRSGEWTHQAEADLSERETAKFFEFFGSVAGDFGRHVKAAVGRQTTKNGASQGGKRSFAGSGSVSHDLCAVGKCVVSSVERMEAERQAVFGGCVEIFRTKNAQGMTGRIPG